MTRNEVLQQPKDAECSLRALFGSVARGEERQDSDIDIMVEFDPAARAGVWGYVSVVQYIEGLFSGRVDVIDRDGLKSHIKLRVARMLFMLSEKARALSSAHRCCASQYQLINGGRMKSGGTNVSSSSNFP